MKDILLHQTINTKMTALLGTLLVVVVVLSFALRTQISSGADAISDQSVTFNRL